ncbi:MAG: tRNA 2-thiocytidine biosynthesis TtcA family protein [candidate division WOR-3 bacterium]
MKKAPQLQLQKEINPSLSRISKIAHLFLRKAISKHQLVDDKEKVLIAVSGGIDSLVLTHLIANYNQRRDKQWDILAVHINPQFPQWRTKPLVKFFENYRINYLISEIEISKIINEIGEHRKLSPCYLCARERRKRLFEIAEEYKIKKIAYAHHLEDVNETYLMNLLFSSKASTFSPKQSFFQDHFFVIRPLYYFDKNMILQYSNIYGIKAVQNRCPYAKKNERYLVRKFLEKLYRKDPRIKTNFFWGIKNLKFEYLP